MHNSYQRITMLIIIHAKHAFLKHFSDAADDNDATFPGNRHFDVQLMRALDFSKGYA